MYYFFSVKIRKGLYEVLIKKGPRRQHNRSENVAEIFSSYFYTSLQMIKIPLNENVYCAKKSNFLHFLHTFYLIIYVFYKYLIDCISGGIKAT